MSGEDTPPNRITVSRDALRADLAEMELRLRVYFDEQLRHKADAATVATNTLLLGQFSRGEFTPAQVASIQTIAEKAMDERTGRSWTARERATGIAALLVMVLSLAASIYFGAQ
jgi:hypothetical protein